VLDHQGIKAARQQDSKAARQQGGFFGVNDFFVGLGACDCVPGWFCEVRQSADYQCSRATRVAIKPISRASISFRRHKSTLRECGIHVFKPRHKRQIGRPDINALLSQHSG